MEIDLLFAAIKQSDWRKVSEDGNFEPNSVEEKGYVKSFTGSMAEDIINHYYQEDDKVLLIVLDPLRIQSPVKKIKEDGFEFVAIQGAVSVDAIIDKIKLQKNKNGKFLVHIKHFD